MAFRTCCLSVALPRAASAEAYDPDEQDRKKSNSKHYTGTASSRVGSAVSSVRIKATRVMTDFRVYIEWNQPCRAA